MKELSQAEQKRRRIQKTNLEAKLAKMLKNFENKFMGAYTKYHFEQVEKKVVEYSIVDAETREATKDLYFGKLTKKDMGLTAPYDNGRYGSNYQKYTEQQRTAWENEPAGEWTIKGMWDKLSIAKKMIQRESLTKFDFMNEANKGWNQRFDKLVLRVLSEAKSTEKMVLAEAGTRGGELEILISQDTQEFHCRFIWVDGVLVAPHHRFIVTTRKIK